MDAAAGNAVAAVVDEFAVAVVCGVPELDIDSGVAGEPLV